MPIEIKELHIKGVVTSEDENRANNPAFSSTDKKVIIDACVEKVLRILEDKKER